jgi:hypothetical protein
MMAAPRQRLLAAAGMAAMLVACGSCPTAAPGGPNRPSVAIPGILKPPAGETLQRTLMADGVQIYECRAKPADATARPAWTLVAPEATLADDKGATVGKHYAGPTWEANDGSRIVGLIVGRIDAPTPDAIPWLLLATHSTGPAGLFSNVTSVQRVATVGGVAPAEGCTPSNLGATLRVAYKAQYAMYVKAS